MNPKIQKFLLEMDKVLWSGKKNGLPTHEGWTFIPVFYPSSDVRGIKCVKIGEKRIATAMWTFLTQNANKKAFNPTTKAVELSEGAQLMHAGHQVTQVYNLKGWFSMIVDGVVAKEK